MNINDFFEISVLMSYYKELLSDKQKDYMEKHYELDYSLSEIADENQVSRQAVHDNIKRGIAVLRDYEEKLGFYLRDKNLKKELEELLNSNNKEKDIRAIIEAYF